METSKTLLSRLRSTGLLLQQDLLLPSVVTSLAGEPIRGSWWKHPAAHQMFACLNEISCNPDVLTTRLVRGKITFVHRHLWPAVLSIGRSQAAWQLEGLSRPAQGLFDRVKRQGSLYSSGSVAHELSGRLLVHDEQVHTSAGHHELLLERWSLWANRAGCRTRIAPREAQRQLEAALIGIGGSVVMLPWRNP